MENKTKIEVPTLNKDNLRIPFVVRCHRLKQLKLRLIILQKLSNILHPSRQNWTTEVCFFLQNENNSTPSHLLLYPCLSQWKKWSTPYVIPPWWIVSWSHIMSMKIYISRQMPHRSSTPLSLIGQKGFLKHFTWMYFDKKKKN